jgi:hypothetical protein
MNSLKGTEAGIFAPSPRGFLISFNESTHLDKTRSEELVIIA